MPMLISCFVGAVKNNSQNVYLYTSLENDSNTKLSIILFSLIKILFCRYDFNLTTINPDRKTCKQDCKRAEIIYANYKFNVITSPHTQAKFRADTKIVALIFAMY